MEEKKNIMDYDTVSLDDENSAVVIIDQTKLPGTTEIIALKTAQENLGCDLSASGTWCSGHRRGSSLRYLCTGKRN